MKRHQVFLKDIPEKDQSSSDVMVFVPEIRYSIKNGGILILECFVIFDAQRRNYEIKWILPNNETARLVS